MSREVRLSAMASAPSAQEIQRKLSTSRVSKLPPPVAPAFSSGAESDSDSMLSPDIASPSVSAGAMYGIQSLGSPQPLSAIQERRTASGEETDEDEDEDDGWRNAPSKMPAPPAAQGLEKSGYLSKKGIRRKTWKKRWFVLRGAHLAYYKSSAEYKVLKLLDLNDVHAVTTCSLKHHKHTFGIVSPSRTLYLQAESDADMVSWVLILNEVRAALQSVPPSGPPTPPTLSEAIPIPPSTPRTSQTFVHSSPVRSIGSPSPPGLHAIQINNVASSDSEAELSPTAVYSSMQHQQHLATAALQAPRIASVPGATSQDANKAILSGYLMKCSSKRRNWRKRWFTLTGEKLFYTTSHMDTRPHRVIPLTQILDALEFDMAFAAGKHPHAQAPTSSPPGPGEDDGEVNAGSYTFKVITPKRTLLLCAPSEEEEIKWMSAIRALIARRSGGAPAVPQGGGGASSMGANASASSAAGVGGASSAVPSGRPAVAQTHPDVRPGGRRPSVVEGLA
ncbi:PH domain-like protein [Auriculariales sp. MPI-PUGE-AT-0066]|nr:PH domain-like protein [Auriculariales sp. MPI-PUGE-AT-0066]